MPNLLSQSITLFRQALERRGGGPKAIKVVTLRGYRIFVTLGLRGLIRRIRGTNGRPVSTTATYVSAFQFPPPAPLDAITLKVGVMAHIFYADLLSEFREQLSAIPVPFSLFVSVVSETDRESAIKEFSKIENLIALDVRVVLNRGRDLAPFLVTFRQEILALDIVCHIHTKKSLYTGNEQERWRKYLLESLFGDEARVAWILGMFEATPQLGMVYPESFETVPLSAHTWLSNKPAARELCDALGIPIDGNAYLDFAAGSMFWARVDALRPVYELGLDIQEFPLESGQTDGTIQHALERVLAQLVKSRNFVLGILSGDLSKTMATEGQRNWKAYFDFPARERMAIAALDASIVSLDIFETLVLRPFLTPDGARAYVGWLIERSMGFEGYADLRKRSEVKAAQYLGREPDNLAIHEALATLAGIPAADTERMRHLELEAERRMLVPRTVVLEAAEHFVRIGKSVIGISDMYLSKSELVSVLPPQVSKTLKELYVSCETGWRKDSSELWNRLPAKLGIEPRAWLHVGDNEHSDIQLPFDLGFIPPVHVLRPNVLLDVVPALRPLKLSHAQMSHWPNQLASGLVCNRIAELADRAPAAFGDSILLEDPETFGYIVFGPLVLDYVNWLCRLARAESIQTVLFLSREGFLLERVFSKIRNAIGSSELRSVYLLASRRGTGTPTLRSLNDLKTLLKGQYTGTLLALLKSRTGDEIAEAARLSLGDAAVSAEVYLPEMCETIVEKLRPIAAKVLEVAERERNAYMDYWTRNVQEQRALISDVGYAGTIQSQLARLTGQQLGGAYFALDYRAATTLDGNQSAWARFHDHRQDGNKSSLILANDLLIESVLTAPAGQFSHFEQDGANLTPVFRKHTSPAFEVVSRIQSGVLKFIDDVCAVAGTDIIELEFDTSLIQQPLLCLNTKLWRLGTWSSKLAIDDDFTGRGQIFVSE